MPAPATVEEFVDLIRKSAVLEDARLSSYVDKLKNNPTIPRDIKSIAGLFVQDGLLTFFQAEQFLNGKWKRFTIGKYKVLEKLGSGGMGQVFLCEHKLMRRRVAVKVLPTQKATDPSSLDRFYREARAVAALDHPNIVRAYDIDQDENLHFLVMEYVDGSSFQEMVRKTGPMNPTRACHYIYWAAVGLQHAHSQMLIHRDIKPGNILVDRIGIVKILDLGLARFFNDDNDDLTKKYEESVLGTADYLAPEQAVDSHAVDGRADIYSLGATFYFLLTGQPPFAEGTVAQKLLWHQSKNPRPVREVRAAVPESVALVVAKMMAKNPEDRYQTPGELAQALLPFTQTPIPPPPDEEMPQLSAAAQGTATGPISVMASPPRPTTSAPKTPVPVPGPKATMTATKPAAPAAKPPTPARRGNAVAVADADTQRKANPAPVIEPMPDPSPPTPIWEAISAETANNQRADTDRKRRDPSSRRMKPGSNSTSKAPAGSGRLGQRRRLSLPLVLTIAGGIVLLTAGALVAYFSIFGGNKGTGRQGSGPGGDSRRLSVLRAAGPGQFTSVQKAIDAANDGDTIAIEDLEWEESAAVSRKRLTFTGPPGKRVVWRAPNRNDGYVLSLANTEGAHISEIIFEANPKVTSAVRLAGACPGLVLENCELRDGAAASLVLHDCTGDVARPVTIQHCRIMTTSPTAKGAVEFLVDSARKKNLGSQSVVIQDCLIEGPPAGAGFSFDDSAAVDIRRCRVWRGASGAMFRKVPNERVADLSWKVNITNCTLHSQTAAGIWIEDATQIKTANRSQIKIAQNFFSGTPIAIKVDGDASGSKFLQFPEENARKVGVLPPQAMTLKLPPLVEVPETVDVIIDPANPARHLTYDKLSPLMNLKELGGKPVGVPPE
jgi:serine/threonine protein kinase